MNKKLIALAVAAAFAAPVAALADNANVTIYGKVHLSADWFDLKDNTTSQPSGYGVSSNSSRIGFRGTEDLGDGLKFGWQWETTTTFDEGTSGVGGARNSFITFGGSWGTLLVGKVDNAYKSSTGKLDPMVDTIGDYRQIISSVGNATSVFDSRLDHNWAYISPNFNGFQFVAGSVPGGGAALANGLDNNATSAWALTGTYDNGPIFATLAYARLDVPTTTAAGEADALKLGLGYNFGNTRIGFVWEQLEVDSNVLGGAAFVGTGAFGGTLLGERDAFVINAAHKFGNNEVSVQYGRADDLKNLANSEATMWAIQLKHDFSKRTFVYAIYADIDNDSASTYGFVGGSGHGDKPAVAAGSDPRAFSIGVSHNF